MAQLRNGLAGVFVPLVLVLGALALGLGALDAVAPALAGPPRDQPFDSVAGLERAIGRRVTVPTYFPSSIAWPPSSVRRVGRAPGAVVLAFPSRSDARVRLLFAQGLTPDEALPDEVEPGGTLLEHFMVRVGSEEAVLSRLRAEDGVIWHELRWRRSGRALLMRSTGTLEELLKVAASVHPEAS